jgi:hypothetical protein
VESGVTAPQSKTQAIAKRAISTLTCCLWRGLVGKHHGRRMDFHHINWFVLFGPALVVSVFVMAIMYKLDCRYPDSPVAWRCVVGIPVFVVLLLCAVTWLFEGRQAFRESNLLFDSPISDVQSIQIRPMDDGYKQLIDHEMTITNRSSIQEIMAAIRNAKPYEANHPQTRWQCFLVISNTSGVSSIRAAKVFTFKEPQGVTEIDPMCDSLSNNALGDILEKLTGYKSHQ